jgi:2-keto-4-pentenoate hydratase/2-oxohepta-3-ene-1,7-dioic acid hydratase in catechol pathway
MRVVRFKTEDGEVRHGELINKTIFSEEKMFNFEDVTILPPSNPSKIIGVGLNYEDHAREMGREPANEPSFFVMPQSVVTGHRSTVELPTQDEVYEFEAELGLVINSHCRNLQNSEGDSYIAGYTCVNDITNRSRQKDYDDLLGGKCFDKSTPIGPVLATPNHVKNDANIELKRNNELKQDSSIEDMVFSPAELIERISQYVSLYEGDIVSTGTPSGTSSISDGDSIKISIEGIGTLEHDISIRTEESKHR